MSDRQVVARNRRAYHDFEVLEKLEAGLVLLGPEVKVLRAGKASIAEAYAAFKDGELYLRDMHVPEYSHAGYAPHDPRRPRKVLLHRRQLRHLEDALARRGLTIVPLELYFARGNAKVELALARGRKHEDKREVMREKEARRDMRGAVARKRARTR
ncbi:MAG: SsrA-binding protein SmpB [bacterium]